MFPHLTVEKNVGFGLEMRGITGPEAARRIAEALELVSLGAYGHRYPKELSGGQQQRVAVARALVVNPDVFLLDEPLSNLDAKLRQSVGMQLRDLQKSLGLTTVFVTHDQKEALMMADRLVIMRAGRVVQEGSAEQLYAAPASYFVADFLGHSNVLTGKVVPEGFLSAGGTLFRCDSAGVPADRVMILRPENLILGPAATGLPNSFEARIQSITYLGAQSEVALALPGGDLLVATHQNRTGDSLTLRVGDRIAAGCRPEAVQLLVDDMTKTN
ncbi:MULTISPECIES: ABC transporter ATP-binding protein [Pseudooceanicola]|uniref:ABC transporter ATP-binding protein n=1 Tax=Pseudooceanicola TaxID=1679449 RepID=UPI0035CBBC72